MLVGTQKEEDPSDNKDAASGLWSFASPTPPKKKKKSLGKQRATIWQAFGCVPRPQGTPVSAEQLFCPMLL